MTKNKENKIWSRRLLVIATISVLLLVLGGGAVLIQRALRLESYKSEILEILQGALHRKVVYDTGAFSFRLTPSFTFSKIMIMEKDGSAPFLLAERLTFKIALLPLLERRLVVRGVVLERPSVIISRDPSGILNISDLLKETGKPAPLRIRGIKVKQGALRFVDRGAGAGEVVTVLREADLSISHLLWGKSSDIEFSALVQQAKSQGRIKINGRFTPPDMGRPLTETSFSGSVAAENLDAGHYWDYYARYVPFRKVYGRLDLDSTFQGTMGRFSSKGKASVAGLRFVYPEIFHSILTPRELSFSYDMELNPREILVKSLDLNVDALNVKGSCALKDIQSRDIFIDARAATSVFRLEDFRGYIPYGIIADSTSEYIEQHVMGGLYRLEKGTLIGRVSQIAHMEKGTNYNVLSIKGTVEKGLVSYGPEVPTFNGISGQLEMRGKDFILTGMKANFGGSPFTLDGRITDYPLTTPCAYPFTMNMKPRPSEVAWLLGREKGGSPSFSGESTLFLQGSNGTAAYSLSGSWDLTSAAYGYRDLISKPSGQASRLSFQSILDKTGTRVPMFQYELGSLAVGGNAEYRGGEKSSLSFSLKSNEFPIQEVAPRFPRISRYRPAGRVRLAVHGTGGGEGPEPLVLGGELSLKGASIVPSGKIAPLTNINGIVGFSGDNLKTSRLTARLGGSTISGSGTLTGFTSPSFSVVFSSPSLALADLGLRPPGKPLAVQAVRGEMELKGDTLSIRSLSGQLNRTVLSLSGTVRDMRNPRADLVLDADYLDMADVALLSSMERSGEGRPPRISLRAEVTADAGSFHKLEFKGLKSEIQFEQKILYLEKAECELLGGNFRGKGRIDFGTARGPRYQASFSLMKISSAHLLQALGTSRELTGAMSLEGDLTAKGDTLDEIKASSLGNIRLHCEKGTLRKFSLLSKLFSILNVSQLFKFRLPDMVSDGMPYNEINASFAFRDGVVTTEDLFIDSNAMNITIVGDFDLVKKQLDVTVGVKPLQTIDKVVSRIPVVGWVLTGKNKSLITTYFEAKGSLDNPTLKSITTKSMAKGVFNIFKRLFSLPAKLVTDTGEVITNR